MKYPVRKLFCTYINVFIINYIHFENYIQVILFSALRFPRQIYFLSFFNRTYFSFFKFLLTLAPSDGLRLAYTGQNINTRILCQILPAPVGRV